MSTDLLDIVWDVLPTLGLVNAGLDIFQPRLFHEIGSPLLLMLFFRIISLMYLECFLLLLLLFVSLFIIYCLYVTIILILQKHHHKPKT